VDQDQNELLTKVVGTAPMGQLLRRYWHPIAAAAELEDARTKAVRFFGEDLVLFRDKGGVWGLIDRRCPHRGMDLSYGIAEPTGIRCGYHGWLFASNGTCLQQPFEETVNPRSDFKARCGVRAYPVQEKAGLLWAYFGPQPAPCLPDWDFFSARGYREMNFAIVPCNWLQCQENSLDPVHFEWMHDYWMRDLLGNQADIQPIRPHEKIDFEEFEWGFVYKRLRAGEDETNPSWTVGRVSLWPNCFYPAGPVWQIPIDDTHTLTMCLRTLPVPGRHTFDQGRVPFWRIDTHYPDGRMIVGQHQQDLIAFSAQGAIQNRTAEHLGQSDRGIIMFRQRLASEIRAVQEGRDPKGIIRDASKNHRIPLPLYRLPGPINANSGPIFANPPSEITAAYNKFCDEQQQVWERLGEDDEDQFKAAGQSS